MPNGTLQRYRYDGPVVMFDRCVQHDWSATTTAPNEQRAISNLKYRWRKENGYVQNVPLVLSGSLTIV